MPEPKAIITPRGAERIHSGHAWIYRSDLRSTDAAPGDVVRVLDDRGRFLACAFYSDRSQITLRVVSCEDVPIDRAFLSERIRSAAAFRERVVEDSEVLRLVYGESDRIPGLVVDRYADCLVVQTLIQATDRLKSEIVSVLTELFSPRGILERNDPRVRLLENLPQQVSILFGDVPEDLVAAENGLRFHYDLLHGQKTGSFLDQRENRRAAARYARGEVLDCFTYNGAFALTVARNAASVEAVDISESSIATASQNQELNSLSNVSFRAANAFDLLREYDSSGRRFDMVILDPPAFAKSRDTLPSALRGYKEINLRAIRLLRPGGCLVTSSCSHHVPEHTFLETIAEAANDARRSLIAVERRTQSRDHPILLTIPETCYLKCIIFMVL